MAFDPQPIQGLPEVTVLEAQRMADFLRDLLKSPQLALVPEACPHETALHKALQINPLQSLDDKNLKDIADTDARDNYAFYGDLQTRLLRAGTLEAHYLGIVQSMPITTPPAVLDLLTEHVVGHMMQQVDATAHKNIALQFAAAQWLFTKQQVRLEDDRLVSDTLDLSHEMTNQLSHGLVFRMNNAKSGLRALAQVLELWVWHMLGIRVNIRAMSAVDDPAWRWHLGLEANSSALLNDLYLGHAVSPDRLRSLVSLFRLDFADAQDVQSDMQGKPVYLGLACDAQHSVKIKPQNLLLNLPLAQQRP